MEGTRGNVDQTTSAQRCYTTLQHNAAKQRSTCGLVDAKLQTHIMSVQLKFNWYNHCCKGTKAQSKNEKWERMQSVYGSDAMHSRATITALEHFSTFEKLQMKPAHGSSATVTAKDFHVFQSSFPPPSHAEQQQNLHCRLRSPSQLWS